MRKMEEHDARIVELREELREAQEELLELEERRTGHKASMSARQTAEAERLDRALD